MSNIYSAKFMLEASTTLESKVFRRSVNETYLFSAMKALHEMNALIDDKTKILYTQINEAESKEDENKLFAEYFYQFKSIFSEFANRMQQLKSRMTIAIENKVETWEELYKDDEYISDFDKQFSFSGYNFPHIEESDYPRLNLYKIYQKEFDYIGQLMQDTSMNASPSVRLKIIASVCNNFAGAARDKNWIKNLIQDMVDIDEKEITRSYSECIYNALRDKYDINVDKGMLYTCKENLADYEDVIEAASRLCDDLLHELDKVAENISSFLFRNKDKKLVIKTDTDGIIDRDYRLDTYSMNQLDLFMKNKVSQMKKVLNVFGIAIGIKFDTAVEYIEQQIEILKMAKTYDCNKVEADEEENKPSAEEPEGNENPEGEEPEEDNEDDDKPEDGDDDDFEFGSSDDDEDDDEEPIEEDDEFGSFDDESEDIPENNNDVIDDNSDGFDEAYIFEAELFELVMMAEEYEMHKAIAEALVLEEETPAENQNNNDQNQNLKKLANKAKDPNFFQKIIAKIKELWERFKQKFFDKTKDKVAYIKANEKHVKAKISGEASLKYTPNFDLLDKFTIPDLNYASPDMQNALEDDTTFANTYFKDFYAKLKEKDVSLTDAIKQSVLGDEQEMADVNTLQVDINKMYDFLVNYEKHINKLKNQMNLLEKAERVAKDLSKVEGDTIEAPKNEGFTNYFMEFDGDKVEKDSTKSNKVQRYFNVCTRALAAYMTVCDNLFNEMYAYAQWRIMKSKGGNTVSDGQNNQNNNQNQNNQQQNTQNQNTQKKNTASNQRLAQTQRQS